MVTLSQFLEITNDGLIETYLASLFVEEWDEDYQQWFAKRKIDGIKNIKELEPYMSYEITGFYQGVEYGEIDRQEIYVRKIKTH